MSTEDYSSSQRVVRHSFDLNVMAEEERSSAFVNEDDKSTKPLQGSDSFDRTHWLPGDREFENGGSEKGKIDQSNFAAQGLKPGSESKAMSYLATGVEHKTRNIDTGVTERPQLTPTEKVAIPKKSTKRKILHKQNSSNDEGDTSEMPPDKEQKVVGKSTKATNLIGSGFRQEDSTAKEVQSPLVQNGLVQNELKRFIEKEKFEYMLQKIFSPLETSDTEDAQEETPSSEKSRILSLPYNTRVFSANLFEVWKFLKMANAVEFCEWINERCNADWIDMDTCVREHFGEVPFTFYFADSTMEMVKQDADANETRQATEGQRENESWCSRPRTVTSGMEEPHLKETLMKKNINQFVQHGNLQRQEIGLDGDTIEEQSIVTDMVVDNDNLADVIVKDHKVGGQLALTLPGPSQSPEKMVTSKGLESLENPCSIYSSQNSIVQDPRRVIAQENLLQMEARMNEKIEIEQAKMNDKLKETYERMGHFEKELEQMKLAMQKKF